MPLPGATAAWASPSPSPSSPGRGSVPPVSFTVLFLGAEYGDTDAYPMGSALFLRDFRPSYPVAVISLNLHAIPSRLRVRSAGRGVVSPSWLLMRCLRSLDRAAIPFAAPGAESQVLRLGLLDERTLIEPWLAAGFPSVQLDGEYPGQPEPGSASGAALGDGESDIPARLMQFAGAFLAANADGIPEDWDRHSLVFLVGGHPVMIGERVYVSVVVGCLLGMLLYSLVFRRGLRKYVRSLTRNLLTVVPILALTFLLLLAGTLAVQGVLALRGFPRSVGIRSPRVPGPEGRGAAAPVRRPVQPAAPAAVPAQRQLLHRRGPVHPARRPRRGDGPRHLLHVVFPARLPLRFPLGARAQQGG